MKLYPDGAAQPLCLQPASEHARFSAFDKNAVLRQPEGARCGTIGRNLLRHLAGEFDFFVESVAAAIDRATWIPGLFFEVGLFDEIEFVWSEALETSVSQF